MIYLFTLILGMVLFLGTAWVAKKIGKPYITWITSSIVGLLLVSYSFYQKGVVGFSFFVFDFIILMLGVIGSYRYGRGKKL